MERGDLRVRRRKEGVLRDVEEVDEVVDVMEVVEAGVEVVILDPHGRRRGCSRSRPESK